MDDKIKSLKIQLQQELKNIENLVDLDAVRVAYLGKKGSITSLMKNMKDLTNEKRKEFGKSVNELKNQAAKIIEEKTAELKEKEIQQEINSMPKFDITTPVNLERG